MSLKRSLLHSQETPSDLEISYRELLDAIHFDLEQLKSSTNESIDRMLNETFATDRNLPLIQSFARESVVNVPALIDDQSPHGHLVIRSNERLETLIDRVEEQTSIFIENAEKCRSWIDLNHLIKNVEWKNELIQMQNEISADQMKMRDYYSERSDLATKILNQPRISDHWCALIELDEDFFFQLRWTVSRLRSFSHRLSEIVCAGDARHLC